MDFNNQYQLLQEVYRGAKMGDISIRLLLPKVDNARFRSDLQTQFRQYQATASNAENQMKAMGRCPKEVTNGKYALLWLSLQGNTLCNRETSHLAEMMSNMVCRMKLTGADATSKISEMMIQGSSMGIVSLTKALNSFAPPTQADTQQDAAPPTQPEQQALDLARATIQAEEDNITRLKVYLQ